MTQQKIAPTKTTRKVTKVSKIETISSDDDDSQRLDLEKENIKKERKRVKPTTAKTAAKRTKVDVPSQSNECVDGAVATKMGLKSSKSAKVKPNTADAPSGVGVKARKFGSTGGSWTADELLSQLQHIDRTTSANIIRLFDDDNTIPFICRYRRELIGKIDPDR